MSVAFARLNQPQAALSSVESAIEIDPSTPVYHLNKGIF